MVQDLAVVVLLMLIPLLAPNESGAPFGLATISKALGLAAIKVQVPSSVSQRIRTHILTLRNQHEACCFNTIFASLQEVFYPPLNGAVLQWLPAH
jgi:hypothetical protein